MLTDIKTLEDHEKVSKWPKKKKKEEKRNQATPGQVAFKLKQLRRDNGYDTVREAAEMAGIRPSHLYKLEKGTFMPISPAAGRRVVFGKVIAALAVVYGVQPEDILLISEAEDNRRTP